MKADAKRKYSSRFEDNGDELVPGEYEELTEIEEKFCARVFI